MVHRGIEIEFEGSPEDLGARCIEAFVLGLATGEPPSAGESGDQGEEGIQLDSVVLEAAEAVPV